LVLLKESTGKNMIPYIFNLDSHLNKLIDLWSRKVDILRVIQDQLTMIYGFAIESWRMKIDLDEIINMSNADQ
jgi:hypothetical protein